MDREVDAAEQAIIGLGFKEFPISRLRPTVTKNWFRIYPQAEPCRCNDKLQVVIYMHQAFTFRPLLDIEVCGADDNDQWYDFKAYNVPLDGDLTKLITKLITAWNTVHQP